MEAISKITVTEKVILTPDGEVQIVHIAQESSDGDRWLHLTLDQARSLGVVLTSRYGGR